MKQLEVIMLGGVLLAGSASLAGMKASSSQSQPAATGQPARAADTDQHNTERGQQVFNQNCSRCHNSPEGFSQHISGTIAKHMRMRAGLSDTDYRALLKFLNP